MTAIDRQAWVETFVTELKALGVMLDPRELAALGDELWPSSKDASPADVARDLYGEH